MTTTGHWLAQAVRPHTRAAVAAWWLVGVAVTIAFLAVGVWLAHRGVFLRAPAVALAVWLAAGVAGALAALAARRRMPATTARSLAALVEARARLRRGSVWAVAERAQQGASAELFAAADAETAQRLGVAAAPALGELRLRGLRRLVAATAASVLALFILLALDPARGRAAGFWRPVALTLNGRATVQLSADRRLVRHGETVRLTVDAPGFHRALLWTRSPGTGWHRLEVTLDTSGTGAVSVGPLGADLLAHATAGSRGSDTVRVTVTFPLFVNDLEITARFPAYLGRAPEPVLPGPDTAWVPAGTVVESTGEVPGVELGHAAWRAGGSRHHLSTRGDRFAGRFAPRASARWSLEVEARDGRRLDDAAPMLTLGVVPDLAPEVVVVAPGADATLPASLQQPLVVEVQDDYGLTAAEVVLRRVSRLGTRGQPWTVPLELGPGGGDRAVLTGALDLDRRGLLPGDTIRLKVRAADNAPAPNWGESREIALRLPTLAELREEARRETRALSTSADSLAAQQREVMRATEALAAERQRESDERARGEGPARSREALGFERSERAREVARQQEALLERVDSLRRDLDAVERALEAAGVDDPEWQRQLEQLRRLLEQAVTPELEERLSALREALQRLDEPATREALQRLAESQARLRTELERSRELFERAAIEGALETLARDADELEAAQRRWTDAAGQRADSSAAARERELATSADSLRHELEQLAKEVAERGGAERGQRISSGAEQASTATGAMQRAAQAAQGADARQAERHGREASEALEGLGQSLREQREELAGEWRAEAVAAIDRALAETARLAQGQEGLVERLKRGATGPSTRGEQSAIEQGVQKLGQQLEEAAGKNALLSPDLMTAFGLAEARMQAARAQLERAAPNAREAAELAEDALGALNAAAYGLLRSRAQVSGAQSGSGLAEALEQLAQLAAQQGALNAQAGALLPQVGGSGGLASQLQRLAAEQRALAEQLERLAAGGGAPSATQPLAEEAKDLAGALDQGRLDPEVLERQERLFRRLLDAGRSLEGEEPDPERERRSETARSQHTRVPTPLAPGARGVPRFPYPSWEDLASLTPEERRLILEYFRRLNGAGGNR